MTTDPVTKFLRTLSWVAWVVILFSLVCIAIFTDFSFPSKASDIANSWRELDIIVCVLVLAACVSIINTQYRYPEYGAILNRVARWFQLLGFSIICFRFWYAVAVLGNVPVHPLSVTAIGVLAMGTIFHQISIWEQMRVKG